jgi:Fe-S-cluster-containing hydrogenase component 2/CRP-like cAMP-binding protein/pSer/pThr/pTyr-binding forkhead associated (FHA) protein
MAKAGAGDTAGSNGLRGEWLSIEQVAALDFFKSGKRAFKIKLNTNFAPASGTDEPGIKAAVRRQYQKGDVICKAGEYGSTAFLILEGSATAFVPESAQPHSVGGRSNGSLRWLEGLFSRRSRAPRSRDPSKVEVGEVSPYASIQCLQPPPPLALGPGDFFGIDTCINFYPREHTVQADGPCVVLEMLRSLLDSVRDAGEAGDRVDTAYQRNAVRAQLRQSAIFRGFGESLLDGIAESASLITADSDAVREGVIYREGDAADAIYLIRSGTIQLAQQRAGADFVFAYLGRGAAFGFEHVVPSRKAPHLRLRCVSHPEVAAVDIVGSLLLGRSRSCDLSLANRAVSRRHCRFDERDGEVYLTDLGSGNLTLLNGESIREALLAPGDQITVVDYVFSVERGPVEEGSEGGAATRVATAKGLDNFEVVRVPSAELRHIAAEDAAFLDTLSAIARAFESSALPEYGADPAVLSELIDLNLYNSQNVLLIDLDRCTRCDECVRACSDAHGGVARFTRDGPRFGHYLVTGACRSCTDPKCMIGCPVGSIRREGSLEIRIESWCIGCQRCANQCPFGNINMVELTPKGVAPMIDPGVASAAAEGETITLRATVCDLCAGYDRPNCVYACPHDAAIRVNPAAFLSAADRR